MQAVEPSHRVARGQASDFGPSAVAILFVALMAVASIPIIMHPLPPLEDYPNHLARVHVIGAIGTDPYLTRFYTVEWELIPNLMFDLVGPLLHRFMNIYLVGQVFTISAFALIASGALVFNRALTGRWSALPLLALPLLYNGVLLVGVMNYIFGIGLALWALAAWLALRERSLPVRLIVSGAFAFALFICHLFALGVYGLGLLAIELQRLWAKRTEPAPWLIADFAATGLPFVPLMLMLMMSPTWHAPGAPMFWQLDGKLGGLLSVVQVYYPSVTAALMLATAAALAIAHKHRVVRFHPVGWVILFVGGMIYLAMPRAIFGAHLADQRLPIALAFMLVACFDLDLSRRAVRAGLLALMTLLLTVRVIVVQSVWNHLDRGTGQFQQSLKAIERGARVLVVWDDRSSCKEISDFNLLHAASLAIIERSALVTTEFTVEGKQILHARPQFKPYVETEDRLPPGLSYFLDVADHRVANAAYFWNLWPQHYDYVYILFRTATALNPDVKHLALVYGGDQFQLYRVAAPAGVQQSSVMH